MTSPKGDSSGAFALASSSANRKRRVTSQPVPPYSTGQFGAILSYVVSVDFIWFGLTGLALFIFRRRDPARPSFQAPWHPFSTGLFVAACWIVVAATVYTQMLNSLIGFAIVLAGLPAYAYWSRRSARERA